MLISLAEKISRQPNTQAVTLVLRAAVSQICSGDQEQKPKPKDVKIGQKGNLYSIWSKAHMITKNITTIKTKLSTFVLEQVKDPLILNQTELETVTSFSMFSFFSVLGEKAYISDKF